MSRFQKTLSKVLEWKGLGLHSGRPVSMRIRPLPANRGIVFLRSDLPGSPEIPALVNFVVNTRMATSLGRGTAVVSTVEHLMCALFGAGVDNALIEVDAPEVPISDGSSIEFFRAIQEIGLTTQEESRRTWRLLRRVEVRDGDKWGIAEPCSRLEVSSSVEFEHQMIGSQRFGFIQGQTSFHEFGAARTFGFLREVEALKRMGLALGGSLDNAVVLDEKRVLNPSGLRFENEFARHKVLDALGDFALAGHSIHARIDLHRSGHDLHKLLLEQILQESELVELAPSRPSRAMVLRRMTAAAV